MSVSVIQSHFAYPTPCRIPAVEAEQESLPWKDLVTLPLCKLRPNSEPRACECRRLACALHVVLRASPSSMVDQPWN